MTQSATISATVVEKILAFLAPLFMVAGTTDIAAARDAAGAILGSYGARSDRELRFAALSIAFGFGALDALSRSADPALVLNQVIRLRGNANALNRAAQQNEVRLEKLRKHPSIENEPEEASADTPAAALPASSATADLLAFARTKLKSIMGPTVATPATATPAPVVPLSRQQRRAAERQAEKLRQSQQQQARLVQRAANRIATSSEPAHRSV